MKFYEHIKIILKMHLVNKFKKKKLNLKILKEIYKNEFLFNIFLVQELNY